MSGCVDVRRKGTSKNSGRDSRQEETVRNLGLCVGEGHRALGMWTPGRAKGDVRTSTSNDLAFRLESDEGR